MLQSAELQHFALHYNFHLDNEDLATNAGLDIRKTQLRQRVASARAKLVQAAKAKLVRKYGPESSESQADVDVELLIRQLSDDELRQQHYYLEDMVLAANYRLTTLIGDGYRGYIDSGDETLRLKEAQRAYDLR